MKSTLLHKAFGLALLAVAATGCATNRIKPVPGPGPDNQSVYQISTRQSAMKVALSVAPLNDAARVLADGTKTTATTALRNAGYQIVAPGPADLDLSLSATQTTFNNAADKFFTLDGSINAVLSDPSTGNDLARTTLSDRAGPELGRDAAAVALAGKLAPALSQWIRANVTPDQISLAASQVQVSRADRHRGREAGFVSDFVSVMSGTKGIVRCETIGVDTVDHTASFRILWRTAELPEGLLPAIAKAIAKAFPDMKFEL